MDKKLNNMYCFKFLDTPQNYKNDSAKVSNLKKKNNKDKLLIFCIFSILFLNSCTFNDYWEWQQKKRYNNNLKKVEKHLQEIKKANQDYLQITIFSTVPGDIHNIDYIYVKNDINKNLFRFFYFSPKISFKLDNFSTSIYNELLNGFQRINIPKKYEEFNYFHSTRVLIKLKNGDIDYHIDLHYFKSENEHFNNLLNIIKSHLIHDTNKLFENM